MKISLNWLQDFIKLKTKDINLISERITNRSAEIEEIIVEGKAFENIVIGEVLSMEKHPDADRLNVTQTTIGAETFQIVCGAKNVRPGLKVAVALIGAELPNGLKIQKTKIRGVESSGMLCAETELGIAEESAGIWELPQDAQIGMQLTEYLGLNDVILDISNTAITNRPDLFSHIGFANEFVANELAEHKKHTHPDLPLSKTQFPLKINFQEDDLAPHYSAVLMKNLKIESSPEWMQKRLRVVGIRPINNIVDITNYVMMELGIPLHAFDFNHIEGKKLTMRKSKKGEKVITLDNITRELPDDVIILEDEKKIFDLCGIMGGANSEISEKTDTILLHAPIFNPTLIRKAMLALAHRTEAATMYEKGVPAVRSVEGLKRAIELILEFLPNAKIGSEIFEKHIQKNEERIIDLPKQEIERVFNQKIENKIIQRILNDLGFIVEEKQQEFQVTVPAYRFGDIVGAHDLIEEIIRIYDVNLLPEILPTAPLKPAQYNTERETEKEIKNILCALGLQEVLTYTFIGPDLLEKTGIKRHSQTIELENPISKELSLMQTSLLPSLLEVCEKNKRYRQNFNLFEFSKVFYQKNQQEISERKCFAGVLLKENFYKTKGLLEKTLQKIGYLPRFINATELQPYMHPGRASEVWIGNNIIGMFFEVHPLVCQNFNLKPGAMAFEIDFSTLIQNKIKPIIYKAIPKFPSINLDISILIDKKAPAEKLTNIIKKTNNLIISAEVIDHYEGEQIPVNKKSLTFAITYQANDRTLTDEEVNQIHQNVLINLEKAGAEIRI